MLTADEAVSSLYGPAMIKKSTILSLLLIALVITTRIFTQEFVHPTDVVKQTKERFKAMETYQAEFQIVTEQNNKKSYAAGTAYYKKGGMVNFTFTTPRADMIISNGKKLWVYMSDLRAVGVQDLDPEKASLYNSNTYEGLITLFSRYHYSFDTPNQPVESSGSMYYVLKLKEKVASGSFTEMQVYIDAQTYLITKIVAQSPMGKTMTLIFKNIELDMELPNSLFQYTVEGNVRVVENPLTTLE